MNAMVRSCAFIIFLSAASPVAAAETDLPPWLRVEANLYPWQRDIKNDTDFTLVINARLPARFSYFSYVNMRGVVTSGDTQFLRSEQNLRWGISDKLPIDLATQAIFARGNGNDALQFGFSWRVHDTAAFDEFFDRIGLIYRTNIYLKRFTSGDEDVWQMEHFFRWNVPGTAKRLYLGGFLDQTFDLDLPDEFPDRPIVTEVQLGVRVFKQLHIVTEYRNNDFRLGNERNLAAGIEYKFAW